MLNTKILIVDDSKVDQLIIQNILEDFQTLTAYDGIQALEVLRTETDIDIIILDLNMPNMNGFEVLEHIRRDFSHLDISILILTNYEEVSNEIKGLELGAVDYIRKPLNSESLLKRIEVHLNLLIAKKEIKLHNDHLEELVRQRTKQLLLTRDITINALVGLLEVRDVESSNHTRRTLQMMKTICEHLSKKQTYKHILTEEKIELMYKTAPLHDIGKVGIPDKILLKPGKLTEDEYSQMKEHVRFGVDAIKSEFGDEEMDVFMLTALRLIGTHHEKFDGTGYPKGLIGKDIPLEGRLMAIIDVYDALTSERVYKEAFSHDYSLIVMKNESGKHFDPSLIEAFLEIEESIHEIAIKYQSKKAGSYHEISNKYQSKKAGNYNEM